MSMNFEVEMDDSLPLRDVVFKTLRKAILKGELKPGTRLMEIQLANKLGVSRTPVREAIRKLELEGLVLVIPRRGAEVAGITRKELMDVLEVRAALEELAAELACERMTKERMAELRQAAEVFVKMTEQTEVMNIAEADVAFHDVIYASTGNQRLINLLNKLRLQMYRFRVEYLKERAVYPKLIEEHEKMIKAIAEKDKATAKTMIKEHIDNQIMTVSDILQKK